jgi:hypothetical protein
MNSVLTALPVVEYDSGAIWGLRVGTIPMEDFFYNYPMQSFYFIFTGSAGEANKGESNSKDRVRDQFRTGLSGGTASAARSD